MLRGWIEYAEAHKSAYDSEIEDDHVLGDEWFKIEIFEANTGLAETIQKASSEKRM